MVFFDRFLGAYRGFLNPKAATLLAPPEWLKEAFGWRESTAGISFSDRAAIQTSAVFAAIRIISQTCGSLPLPIFRRLERGKERLPNHRLRLLLNEQPNPDMPAMVFREALTAHAVSWGNGYAEIRRDMTGRARELWPLAPDRVTPEREGDEFMRARGATPGQEPAQIVYRVKNEGLEDSFLPARDVLHIPGLGWDGVQGYSVIAFARESIGLNMAAERFGAAFFGNGTHASGVVEMDGHFKDDSAIQRFRRNWQEKNAGWNNPHSVKVLEDGLKFKQLTIPPDDAQFIETREFEVVDIARWFGVPPHKIGDLKRATFSNIEHQSIEFVTDTIRPWLVRWEQEINRKLRTAGERDLFAEHVVEGLLRGDIKSRYEAHSSAIVAGWQTRNEARETENRNPIEGLDEPLEPMNMQPAGSAPAEDGDATNARLQALLQQGARRVVNKEADQLSRAMTEAKDHGSEAVFAAWRQTWIPKHARYVAEAMQIPLEVAETYVGSALAESLARLDDACSSSRPDHRRRHSVLRRSHGKNLPCRHKSVTVRYPDEGSGLEAEDMKVDPILTAREVAEDLRVSKAQVHRLFRGEVEGVRHLPYLAIGRRQVVPRSALEKWKKENVSGMIPGGSEENAVARN